MRKRTLGILILLVLLCGGAAAGYVMVSQYYENHFFEHTYINGIDVSDLTVREAESLIASEAENYQITLTERNGETETIDGQQIGYQFVSDGETQRIMDEQNTWLWLPAFFGQKNIYSVETAVTYNETLLEQTISMLACADSSQTVSPSNAYLTQNEDGSYAVVDEVEGNETDPEKLKTALTDAVKNGETELNLEEAGCYKSPSVYSENGSLKAEAALRNQYASLSLTIYVGGGESVILDSASINSWFSLDENLQPVFDYDGVYNWVCNLAANYDTYNTCQPFTTSNGELVYPESVSYGWQMDVETTTNTIYDRLLECNTEDCTASWYETAFGRGDSYIGNTYVEIDYTNQRMWYYKDGVLLVETPVVTGNVSAGTASPEGVYCIVSKEENAVLVGEDYKTPVNYWMPFCGGVGIHDADSWRTVYGGDIYQYSGSHGCINTPTDQAAVIYNNIEVGTPVVCYSSGINYGYEQVTVSGTAATDGTVSEDGSIIIYDEDSTILNSDENSEGTAADTYTDGQEVDIESADLAAGFDITVSDSYSDQNNY